MKSELETKAIDGPHLGSDSEAMKYPHLIVCKEKHGTGYFHIPSRATAQRVALTLLEVRYLHGGFYHEDDPDLKDIKKARETQNGALAYDILIGRNGYEYEGFRPEEYSIT